MIFKVAAIYLVIFYIVTSLKLINSAKCEMIWVFAWLCYCFDSFRIGQCCVLSCILERDKVVAFMSYK